MNYRMILRLVCYIFRVEAVCLLPSFFISLFLGEEAAAFGQGASMALCAVLSLVTCLFPLKEREIGAREGFLGVALCWVVVSLAGGLPLLLQRRHPQLHRLLLRDSLRLYHHRLQHPHRCGGHAQGPAVLAELHPLAGGHGGAGVPAGGGAHGPGAQLPAPRHAGGEPRPPRWTSWCPPCRRAPRSSTPFTSA